MIGSAFAKTAQGVADFGVGVAALPWRDDPPQFAQLGGGIARALGGAVADPLARLQFEYRGATVLRRFSADAHESAALRLSALDFVPDQIGPGAWAFGPAAAASATREASPAGSGTFDWPAGTASLFDTTHGNWAA